MRRRPALPNGVWPPSKRACVTVSPAAWRPVDSGAVMKATRATDRTYDIGPSGMSKVLLLSLERMWLKITRSTPGAIDGRLGTAIASGLRLNDAGLTMRVTV